MHSSPNVCESVESCDMHDVAIKNPRLVTSSRPAVFARHQLATRKNKQGSNDCGFRDVTAEGRNEFVRDPFTHGLSSHIICQRLEEENSEMIFDQAFNSACFL